MASDTVTIKVSGLDELKRALRSASESIRKRAVRAALKDAGRVIQAAAKQAVPVLKAPTKYRRPGTLKRRITVRASRLARRDGDEGVFINIRPLSGKAQVKRYGKASATNPNDPYYWRWVEFGTKKMSARSFLRVAATEANMRQALGVFTARLGPQIQKLNDRVR